LTISIFLQKNQLLEIFEMSIYYLSELELQVNQYFKSKNTMALADSTKTLYNAVLRKKLLPFCKDNGITKLNEKFTDHMDSFGVFLQNKKVSAHTKALIMIN